MSNKQFYKRILAVALPIMIQNGITNFVQMLDNVMVGQVGTIPMSGVAINGGFPNWTEDGYTLNNQS